MSQVKMRHAIGVDFGGTNVKMALVTERGEVLERRSYPTTELSSREAWLDGVARGLDELMADHELMEKGFAGIGVGVPGFVDYERGFIHDLTNVPGWHATHLSEMMVKRFGVHARVDNDVNAMALGECTFGAGRAYRHAVFVTLGTGVGGGLLINNQLYRGAYSMAGEIGHLSIDLHGEPSPQGRGGLEQYVGNRRLVDRVLRMIDEGRPSAILDGAGGDRNGVTPKLIVEAARGGDDLALETIDFMADCLAAAFASLTYVLQPQAFIVGGGVAQAGDILFDPLRKHLTERLSPHFAERIVVKPAELGNDAGVIGSATLVFL